MEDTVGKCDPRVAQVIRQAQELYSHGQTEFAIEHVAAVIPEFPAVGSLHGFTALFLYKSGRFDEAIRHGRQAVFLSPGSQIASLILFAALGKAGNPGGALEEMKRFLAVKPSQIYSNMIKMWSLQDEEGGTARQPTPEGRADEVRAMLALLEIDEKDVSDAVGWVRKIH